MIISLQRTKTYKAAISLGIVICLLFFSVEIINAQKEQESDPERRLTVGTLFNTNASGFDDNLPFWLHANQQGLFEQRSANALFFTEFDLPILTGNDLSIRGSGKLTGQISENSDIGANTLSLRADYRSFIAQVGKFIDPVGMNYHPLSSGSMMVSTNAEPVPKIMIKTDGFLDVPLAQGYVQFSTYLSHGWFEDSRYVKNVYLHQKYLYLKINYKMLEGIGGVIHNVQWGGTSPDYGKLPSSFNDYIRMVFAQGAEAESGAPGGEQSNSLGNSVAAYDFNLRISLDQYRLTFYRLFYLEDKVSSRFRSPWDGMWGGGIIFKEEHPILKSLLYEHINTKRQDSFDFEPRGSQNYYSNFVYRSGWTYKNRVLGNPLILTNGSNRSPITNNIIVAHHLGANGFISPHFKWKAYYTFSRNYGVVADQIIRRLEPGDPIRAELRPLEELKKVNHSIFIGSNITLPESPRFHFNLGVAADLGELYTDRFGIIAGITYDIID
ncbi:MAG: capsule assembly Wzi family protein [Balneolaceae bacterium]|nr:capsule assembly Wzi family protein [Balneolaceae bacterium]